MLRELTRNLLQQFGYDIVKTKKFEYGKKFKKQSSISHLDYYETPVGKYFLPRNISADSVANTIKRGGIFDLNIIDIAKEYIKPGTTVLDVGANYGQMSIEFGKLTGNSGAVFAFEAQEMVYQVLQANLEANNAKNVRTFFNAVYDTDGVELFFPAPDLSRFDSYGSYGIDPHATSGNKIKTLTIDSLNFEKPVSFMKVDIQGSDLFAMKGAVNTIRKYQMPIIFEYEEQFQQEFGTSFQDYVDFVNSINYRFVKTVQDINYLVVPKE